MTFADEELQVSAARGYRPFAKERCPYCGNSECDADWTDVGVGQVQTGPYHCNACGATEIGPYDTASTNEAERKCGWYQPGNLPDSVSSINGVFIDAATALNLYRRGVVEQVPFKLTMEADEVEQKLGFSLRQ